VIWYSTSETLARSGASLFLPTSTFISKPFSNYSRLQQQFSDMEAFVTRKRPLATVDANADHLSSPGASSLPSPSSPPAKKAKTATRKANPTAKAPRTKKAPAKSKAAQTPGHCSLNKKEFGDRIKGCLALEKYEVQRVGFKVCYHIS
jgi:hypothetical protein